MTFEDIKKKYADFFAQFNGKSVEFVDASNKNDIDQLIDIRYNGDMKIFRINSKTYGVLDVLVDDKDYEQMVSLGKWNVSVRRNRPYVQKRIKKDKIIELHRFLLNAKKGEYVDHINKNTLDNRRCNLRICTNAANLRNGKIRPNNTSGYTGIFNMSKIQPHRPWHAQIRVNYKVIGLGSYKTFEDAVKARKQAEIKYFNI